MLRIIDRLTDRGWTVTPTVAPKLEINPGYGVNQVYNGFGFNADTDYVITEFGYWFPIYGGEMAVLLTFIAVKTDSGGKFSVSTKIPATLALGATQSAIVNVMITQGIQADVYSHPAGPVVATSWFIFAPFPGKL